jgi:hypothetical protein
MSKPNKIVRKIADAMMSIAKDSPSDCVTWNGGNVFYSVRFPGTKITVATIRGTSLGAVTVEIDAQRTCFVTTNGEKSPLGAEALTSYIQELSRAAAIAAKITEQL